VAKPVAPMSITAQLEGTINVTQTGPGRFFVDLGREIQGGLVLTLEPTLGSSDAQRVRVQVTVAEELTLPTAIMYPPRTTTHPRVQWAHTIVLY
jgi:hypothetical protein